MLRLLRLVKILRILRASRIFTRWQNSISMKFAYRDLLSLTVTVILGMHLLACALGMAAQLMQAQRDPDLLSAVELEIQNDASCFGCVQGTDDFDHYCTASCYTPCELNVKARLLSPNAYDEELAESVRFLRMQESWACRASTRGTIRPMPQHHGDMWVAGLYMALLQMGGGVGAVGPTNRPSARGRTSSRINLDPCLRHTLITVAALSDACSC